MKIPNNSDSYLPIGGQEKLFRRKDQVPEVRPARPRLSESTRLKLCIALRLQSVCVGLATRASASFVACLRHLPIALVVGAFGEMRVHFGVIAYPLTAACAGRQRAAALYARKDAPGERVRDAQRRVGVAAPEPRLAAGAARLFAGAFLAGDEPLLETGAAEDVGAACIRGLLDQIVADGAFEIMHHVR